MTHAAQQHAHELLVERALLGHETDVAAVLLPQHPLDQGEVHVAEVGDRQHRPPGVRKILQTGHGWLQPQQAEHGPPGQNRRGVQRFPSA